MKRTALLFLLLLPFALDARELSLDECLKMARSADVKLRNASLDVLASEAQKREAAWEYAPRVSLSAMGYKAWDPMLKITLGDVLGSSDEARVMQEELTARAYERGIKPYYTSFGKGWGFGLNAVQPIYAGGRIRTGNKLAALGVESARVQLRLRERESRDSIENKYWRVVALQEKELSLQGALRLLDTLDKDLCGAVEAGLATAPQLRQLRASRSELLAAGKRLRNGLKLTKMDLLGDIGYDYSFFALDGIHLCDKLSALPRPEEVILDENSIGGFDESRLLALRTEAGELQKLMELGELLPQFSVGAAGGYGAMMDGGSGKLNGVIYASLQVPLTDLGKAAERSRRHNFLIEKYRNEQEYLDGRLLLALRMCALQVESSWEEIVVAQEKLANALDTKSRCLDDYRAGRLTSADVVKAELDVLQAREALTAARIDYRIAVNAYRSRCGIDAVAEN